MTKGDNNNVADTEPALAKLSDNIGFTVTYAGYIVHFATSTDGALFLLILLGVLFIILFAHDNLAWIETN